MKWTDVTVNQLDAAVAESTRNLGMKDFMADSPEVTVLAALNESQTVQATTLYTVEKILEGWSIEMCIRSAVKAGIRAGWHLRDQQEALVPLEVMMSDAEMREIQKEIRQQ